MKFDKRISRLLAKFMLASTAVSCFGCCASAMENTQDDKSTDQFATEIMNLAIREIFYESLTYEALLHKSTTTSAVENFINSDNFGQKIDYFKLKIAKWIKECYHHQKVKEISFEKYATQDNIDAAVAKLNNLSKDNFINIIKQILNDYIENIKQFDKRQNQ